MHSSQHICLELSAGIPYKGAQQLKSFRSCIQNILGNSCYGIHKKCLFLGKRVCFQAVNLDTHFLVNQTSQTQISSIIQRSSIYKASSLKPYTTNSQRQTIPNAVGLKMVLYTSNHIQNNSERDAYLINMK